MRGSLLWTLVLLAVLLATTCAGAPRLKRCSGKKPGKSTGGCGFTCNRQTGEWRTKRCRSYIQGGSEPPAQSCWTKGGPAPWKSLCVFPFTFEGVSYNKCITTEEEGRAWCITDPGEALWGNCWRGEGCGVVFGRQKMRRPPRCGKVRCRT